MARFTHKFHQEYYTQIVRIKYSLIQNSHNYEKEILWNPDYWRIFLSFIGLNIESRVNTRLSFERGEGGEVLSVLPDFIIT